MLMVKRLFLLCAIVLLFISVVICAQNLPGTDRAVVKSYSGLAERDFGSPKVKNVMVSFTPPANVKRIKLYEKTPNVIEFPENELNPMEPTLDLYIPDAGRGAGAGVLLCPGGGYEMLTVPGEGGTIAEFFKAHNIAAFVVRYRHGPQYHYPTTLLDAQRALRHIKAHAKEYHVDPDRIGVFGGSAGGHLAAMLATLYDSKLLPEGLYEPDEIDRVSARPAFVLMLYPVIDLTEDLITHKSSRKNLTQENPGLYGVLSPWKNVTKDTPPAFVVHGSYDFLVPVKNSLLYYEACIKVRVPVEMHLLDTPMHGFGMATNLNDETVKEWPVQAVRFINRYTGSN